MTLTAAPRSVRNNNPGNLRKGIKWDGLASWQSDPDYCVFILAVDGFRALALDLHTKWKQDGLVTVRSIIGKYAPPSENDTGAYVKAVCEMMGVGETDWLDLDKPEQLAALARAIAVHESGGWFFSVNDLNEGVRLALQLPPP